MRSSSVVRGHVFAGDHFPSVSCLLGCFPKDAYRVLSNGCDGVFKSPGEWIALGVRRFIAICVREDYFRQTSGNTGILAYVLASRKPGKAAEEKKEPTFCGDGRRRWAEKAL